VISPVPESGLVARFRWEPTMAGVGKSLATRTDLLLEHWFGATAGQSPTWRQTVNLIGKHYGVREDLFANRSKGCSSSNTSQPPCHSRRSESLNLKRNRVVREPHTSSSVIRIHH
jgi:hypothetical protein